VRASKHLFNLGSPWWRTALECLRESGAARDLEVPTGGIVRIHILGMSRMRCLVPERRRVAEAMAPPLKGVSQPAKSLPIDLRRIAH
jgi:hypothetical protein